jgi:hypothetical protein
MPCDLAVKEPEKIGGYDRWKVRSAVTTLEEAEDVKSDKKFLKVVLKEMDKKADKTEKTASIIRKTSAKLKSVFGKKDNPNPKGGY